MKKLMILTLLIVTTYTLVSCNTNDNAMTEASIQNILQQS